MAMRDQDPTSPKLSRNDIMIAKTLQDKKLSAIEKVEGVRKQAKDLEQKALRQEKLLQAGQQSGGKVKLFQDEAQEDNVE